jgi:uncharacterized protein
MPLEVNLRHLDAHNVRLEGELSAEELDIDTRDNVIKVKQPLQYDLEVQLVENGLLVQGELRLVLNCECVRCLKAFEQELVLDPWSCHVPLQGEDATPIVNDCVDLTPFVREDILLEFPQHPLCNRECGGLPDSSVGKSNDSGGTGKTEEASSAWAELNKLKF